MARHGAVAGEKPMSAPIECRLLASGVPGAEGPLTDKTGRLWFVAPSVGEIRFLEENGSQAVLANSGGVPAGLHRNASGELWVADMRRGILRLDSNGTLHPEVVEFEGAPIRGCNDLCFDHAGNLYFTAPAGSSAANPVGEVFCRLATGEVRRLAEGFAFCNGIAVSADGRRLFVAETFTRSIQLFELEAPGVPGPRSCFAVLPGSHPTGPDGMDFDAAGNLISTNYGEGSLDVFAPDGSLVRRIFLPFKRVSNLHFRASGSTEVIVTEQESNSLWSFDYGAAGQAQPGWA